LNRWLVSAGWLFAVLALVSASTKGSMGVAALWAVPAALVVTVAGMGWPDKPMARLIGVMGVVWQLALIGAYWPFASRPDAGAVLGPVVWPVHSIVIVAVLLCLTLAFLALFLVPALSLRSRLERGIKLVQSQPEDLPGDMIQVLRGDGSLVRLWQEYLNQIRPSPDAAGRTREFAHSSARAVFDAATLTQSRLRMEFFRNLPGMLTGIGIIGTFSGLIMGLRQFRISEDPAIVQRSLEALLAGVWEAFLVSAMAITLAIVVTVLEKLVLSAINRKLDTLAQALDGVYPPRPQPEAESWAPQLLSALKALAAAPGNAGQRPAGAAQAPQALAPLPDPWPAAPSAPAAQPQAVQAVATPANAADAMAAVRDVAQQSMQATAAMAELARGLPELLAQHANNSTQGAAQTAQVMKTLSARLEGVASSIELSGRKTLETVAARLMQSEMNMVSRHHAVAEHLGELVQRIEALCGLLQQDRADLMQNAMQGRQGGDGGNDGLYPAPGWPAQGRANGQRRGPGASPPSAMNAGNDYNSNPYPSADSFGAGSGAYPSSADPWGDPQPQEGRFGS
jgi:hypothetical protein